MSFHNRYSHFHRKETVATTSSSTVQSSSPNSSLNPSAMYNQRAHNNQHNQKNMMELPAGSIMLYNITPDEFYAKIKEFIKEALQQDQLLTKQGAMKMAGVSTAKFKKAIDEGIIVPQLIKGRTTAMYLESQVIKIAKKKQE